LRMAVNLVAADEMVLCSVKEVEANPPPLLSPSSLGEDVCQPPSADWNLDDVSNENDQSLAAGFVEELVDGFSIVCFERLDLMQREREREVDVRRLVSQCVRDVNSSESNPMSECV
ncbi:hypothetical protein T4B_14749, partial [Trichinella pseudospiralis]